MEMHTRASLLAVHGFDGSVGARSSIGAYLSNVRRRIQDAARRRRDYEMLMAKSDHELADMGLTRDDVIVGIKYGRWPTRRGRG